MAVTSNAVRQLSDGNTVGTVLGQSTSDKIGFYGVTTPVVKPNVTGSLTSGVFSSNLANAMSSLGLITYTPSA